MMMNENKKLMTKLTEKEDQLAQNGSLGDYTPTPNTDTSIQRIRNASKRRQTKSRFSKMEVNEKSKLRR